MPDRFADLLRHGAVEGGGRFRGGHDDPLSAAGWTQLRHAVRASGEGARPGGWDRIISSPARRCLEFARDLATCRGLPLTVLPALGERGFGAWEGVSADEVPIEDLSRFWADPLGYTPPGAEPFSAFRERVRGGWQAVLHGDARHPLVVTHGGVVRVIIGEVLGLAAEALLLIEVPPACRTRLRLPVGGGRPSLISHGQDPAPRRAAAC